MSRFRFLVVTFLLVVTAAALPALAACGDDDNATPSKTSAAGSSRTGAATKTSKATATKEPQNGGGNTEYYQKLGEISADTNKRISDASSVLSDNRSETDIDQDKAALDDYLNTYQQIVQDAIDSASQLDPPSEAKDAHEAFLSAIDGIRSQAEDFQNQLRDVNSIEEENALFDTFNTSINDVLTQANQACADLQTAADSAGAVVNLDCTS